jgi:hypothetical protein
MRGMWMHGLGVALLALLGCQTNQPNLKPKLAEEYVLPPSDDARFSEPIAYPKETLNSAPKKDPNNQPGSGPARTPRFGGGNAPSGLNGY